MKFRFGLALCVVLIIGCAPIKNPLSLQYSLDEFSAKKMPRNYTKISILVSTPEAMAGNQTEQMHYIKKPFAFYCELNWFGKFRV